MTSEAVIKESRERSDPHEENWYYSVIILAVSISADSDSLASFCLVHVKSRMFFVGQKI